MDGDGRRGLDANRAYYTANKGQEAGRPGKREPRTDAARRHVREQVARRQPVQMGRPTAARKGTGRQGAARRNGTLKRHPAHKTESPGGSWGSSGVVPRTPARIKLRAAPASTVNRNQTLPIRSGTSEATAPRGQNWKRLLPVCRHTFFSPNRTLRWLCFRTLAG